MAKATVHSTICGFEHKIEGKRNGETFSIFIESPCEKIQKMSGMEISMMEIFDIKENYVMNKAQELKCSSNCLVPCGILLQNLLNAPLPSFGM